MKRISISIYTVVMLIGVGGFGAGIGNVCGYVFKGDENNFSKWYGDVPMAFSTSVVVCAFGLAFYLIGKNHLHNDTLFSINPGTGAETQLTKLVPSPSGQSGKVLSSNGTNYSWITPTVYLSSNGDGSALTGLTKSQVGLGNVDNTSDATKNSASAVLSSKTLATFNYAADAGSNDSYVISLSPAPASYTAGMIVFFKANTVNTGAASINVNSLGVKTIVKRVNTTLANGDIPALALCMLIYDGTNFVLLNPVVN